MAFQAAERMPVHAMCLWGRRWHFTLPDGEALAPMWSVGPGLTPMSLLKVGPSPVKTASSNLGRHISNTWTGRHHSSHMLRGTRLCGIEGPSDGDLWSGRGCNLRGGDHCGADDWDMCGLWG